MYIFGGYSQEGGGASVKAGSSPKGEAGSVYHIAVGATSHYIQVRRLIQDWMRQDVGCQNSSLYARSLDPYFSSLTSQTLTLHSI